MHGALPSDFRGNIHPHDIDSADMLQLRACQYGVILVLSKFLNLVQSVNDCCICKVSSIQYKKIYNALFTAWIAHVFYSTMEASNSPTTRAISGPDSIQRRRAAGMIDQKWNWGHDIAFVHPLPLQEVAKYLECCHLNVKPNKYHNKMIFTEQYSMYGSMKEQYSMYGSMKEQYIMYGSMKEQYSMYGSMKEQYSMYGSMKEQYIMYGSMKEQYIMYGSMKEQYIMYGSMKEQYIMYGSMKEQYIMYGSMKEQYSINKEA
ncbi:hypothetical protein NQZ68_015591 [Dissostichus eleginoides]|nr:hypothetical protein NQZ68_015591 [Dissostichus eleginoides]